MNDFQPIKTLSGNLWNKEFLGFTVMRGKRKRFVMRLSPSPDGDKWVTVPGGRVIKPTHWAQLPDNPA